MKAVLDQALGILLPLATVAAVTLLIGLAKLAYKFEHVTILYLIPVLVAALRWGVVPAIIAGSPALQRRRSSSIRRSTIFGSRIRTSSSTSCGS